MKIQIKKRVSVLDHLSGSKNLEPGNYDLETMSNPLVKNGPEWLVIKGTKIGMTRLSWEAMLNNDEVALLVEK